MTTGIDLTKLVPKESDLSKRTTLVEFKGIKFRIRYMSRATLMSLAEHCTISGYDPTSKVRKGKLDVDKYISEIATTIVQDWENCTVATLSKLMVMNVDGLPAEKLEEPIPFNKDNLMMVVRNVHDLDAYLQDCSTDASIFKPAQDEALTKNLSSSPNTT